MPIEYSIDHEKRLVIATGYGVVTDQDVFGYQCEAWSRPEVQGYDELVDMTDARDIALPSVDRMRELVSLSSGMDPASGSSRLAIVATGDVAFALGRMYAALRGLDSRSTKRVEAFRTMAEALKFLEAEGPS